MTKTILTLVKDMICINERIEGMALMIASKMAIKGIGELRMKLNVVLSVGVERPMALKDP